MKSGQTPASEQAGCFGFIHGGYGLARAAIEPKIRAEVRAEYAARWNAASIWRRLWLQREMAAEIERRVRMLAKPESFY